MIRIYSQRTKASPKVAGSRIEALLKKALAIEGRGMPKALCKNPFGKPFLAGENSLHFNGSHSGDYEVCALSARPVGIDLQKKDGGRNVLGLSRRFMTASEHAVLTALAPEDVEAAFYQLWAQKESYMKYRGLGFSLPLSAFEIRFDGGDWCVYEKGMRQPLWLRPVAFDEDYALWVCAEEEEIQLWRL